ncbi:p21-activated protein kinase-interacting protein 1 [Solea senegalensis]|uniref:P21-activated protein kinase-interacting protein 1 n=1 Tax=Solea senegalensis TaxID=28829 RepID=A0AAV6T4I8_SOLSE|nr:p21-activated protein kinase-interacting protein 1-like [Solea senegalensis]KAG7524453.1 p21-activated protein kinase-interacting protein 1 [Solea senegalensis]
MAAVVELVAGSYEQVAFGYRVKTDEEEWISKADFTHHAHTASISAVAASERFVVTGSKDETIQLYDMKKRIEHGVLLHHDGTITCLEFYGTSHLLSGGEDGLLCVWSTKKWECLKSIKAHKGHVTSLSVHPSGKLALSVGTDKTLRTWNLINGRSAFIKNIKQNAHIVRWSPDGNKYVVVVDDTVNIYDLETASVTGTITNPKRISSIKFLNNSILAVAGDDEILRLCELGKEKSVCEFKAHETRVKAVDSFDMEDYCVVVTASNDGFIKMWKLLLKEELDPPTLLGEVNTTARLTCLAVWKPSSVQQITEEPAAQATTSEELAQELSKTKRVRITMEEVILEDESKPKKKKKGGGK